MKVKYYSWNLIVGNYNTDLRTSNLRIAKERGREREINIFRV